MLVLVVFPILTESTTPPPSAPPYPLRHCELVQTMCSLITARELTVKVFAVSQTWSGQLGVAGSQRWAVMFLVTYAFSTSYVKEPAVAFPEVSTVLTVRACSPVQTTVVGNSVDPPGGMTGVVGAKTLLSSLRKHT